MHCPFLTSSSSAFHYRHASDTSQSQAGNISLVFVLMMDTVADLFVSSLLDDLFHRMYTIFGILGWFDDPSIHEADLLQQIVSKVIVSGLKFGRPLHYMSWCDNRLMASVLLVSPNDGGVHGHKAMNQALLSPKYVPPRISPCFRRVDNLGIAN